MTKGASLLSILLTAKRPSRISDMKAVALPRIMRRGYDGLTLFGHIITHTQEEAEALNNRFDEMKNHEMIHLYQARSTHDSWLCFYWKYGLYWLKAQRYRRKLKNAGYVLNPFEMEAYGRMYDMDYLKRHPEGCTEWKHYAAMSLEERMNAYVKRKQNGKTV